LENRAPNDPNLPLKKEKEGGERKSQLCGQWKDLMLGGQWKVSILDDQWKVPMFSAP
jgi:hypothetical protein